jgi:hypothetical protein
MNDINNNEQLFINLATVTGRRKSIIPSAQSCDRYMPFCLTTKIFILIIAMSWCLSCTTKNQNCLITFEKIVQSDSEHLLINRSDLGIEDKNFAVNNMGGYYDFYKNGLIKSYSFIASQDTTYNKDDKSYQAIGDSTADSLYSICSYAELYDSTGQLKKVYGNPLVLKEVEISKNKSINVTLHFYSFNKSYDSVNVFTNTANTFQLVLTKDSVFSNMQSASFSYNIKNIKKIKIYIKTNFLNCANTKVKLSDSIIINRNIPTEKKNGM